MSDDDIPPDPGPVVRMVAHLKEAAMIAYRLGHNGVRAESTTVGSVEEAFAPDGAFGFNVIRMTIKRALDTDDINADLLANFVLGQIERGVIAGSK